MSGELLYMNIKSNSINSSKVFTGFIWRFAERCGAQGVNFLVSLILARLLEPEVFGTVALVNVITLIMQVFIDSGLGTALIQKKDVDDLDFSSVFYFNIFLSFVLYGVVFYFAPIISEFYNMPDLTPIIRVLSLTFVISGVRNVQQAYISRNMLFKKFFFSTLAGIIISALVGILLIINGYGIWGLIVQGILNKFIDAAILSITSGWHPRFIFSFKRIKSLFSFGTTILITNLISVLYKDMRQLIIGKIYSPSDLAFYNKGNDLPNLVSNNLKTSIDSVLFPALSKKQDDIISVKNMTRRSLKISVYLMAPFMAVLSCCSKQLISIVLTEKWLPCIPFLFMSCIAYLFEPINSANLNAIKALGQTKTYIYIDVLKKIIGISLLLLSMRISIYAIAFSMLISNFLEIIINAFPNKKLLDYTYKEQITDILPSLLLSFFIGIIMFLLSFLKLNYIVVLFLQLFIGFSFYIFGSIIFKIDSFEYLLITIKGMLRKKKEV